MLTPLLFIWKRKFVLKMRVNAWGNKRILYHKTNKEVSTVLCSVVKHLGSGWSTQEVGRNTQICLVFPPTAQLLATSCMLYNRTEHSRGFFIC